MSFTNPYPASRLTLDTANSLANGLVGFWPLTDGGSSTTAKDITSNANDGTLSGGAWATGDIGTSVEYNGTASQRITASTGYDFSTGSVSFWFYANSTTASGIGLVGNGSGSDYDWMAYLSSSGTALYFFKKNSSGTAENSTATTVVTNQWNHATITKTGTSVVIYVNGVQANTMTLSDSSIRNTFGFAINAVWSATSLTGFYQNVRIYNRALSATEVATLYNRPWEATNYGTLWPYSPPVPADATLSTDTVATSLNVDLEGWWLCTDNTGTTLVDISGNGRDATLYGTNSWVADSVGTVNRFDNSSSSGNNARTAQHQIGLSNYTVAFWINNEDAGVSGAKYGGGFCLTDGSGPPSVSDVEVYFRRDTSNQWPQLIHNRSNGGTLGSFTVSESNKASQKDVWKFWVITFDGTNARVYRDGSLISTSGTLAAPLSTTGKHIVINGVQDSSTGLTCSMQNIRLYSRALSADEITLLYERPFEGITYGDAFHYDPPTPANLTPLTSDPINTNQVGWWPLTETDDYASGAADISGNANNGTQSGGVLSEVSRLGGVASFDGVNDQISSSATSTSPTTWSAWVYNDQLPSVGAFIVSGNASSARNDIWTAPAYYRMWAGTTYVDGTSVPKVKEWQHIVGIFDGASSKLYVDGVLEGTGNPGSHVLSSGITIGSLGFSTAYRFDGLISNVRLWSRALSEAEVWSIYENPWLGSAYQASAAAVYYNYILRSKRFRRLS